MSPLERIEWLRRVRDMGAPQSALSVAIECAYRDGGDGAWGSLGGAAIGERAARAGRVWLVDLGFLRRIHRAWLVATPSGTTVPEYGTAVPLRNDDAGKRHGGASGYAGGTVVPESGTVVPQAKAQSAPKTAPACRRNGTVVPEKRHGGAAEQGLTGKEREREALARSGEAMKTPKAATQPRTPRDELREVLASHGMNTAPAPVQEWSRFLSGPVVEAATAAEALLALKWILKRADRTGVQVRYAREAVELGRAWRAAQQAKRAKAQP